MNRGSERLEHLFSRCLDNECTPQERQLLERLLRDDAELRALYADYGRLDRLVGDTLRDEAGQARRVIPMRAAWSRVAKALTVAAAAGLAAIAWYQPSRTAPQPGGPRVEQAGFSSWFAPAPAAADVVEPVSPGLERPQVRLQGTQRDWIVIPGDEPGEVLVIEVNRVRTHAMGVHRDF
jgi:hypothetical protein